MWVPELVGKAPIHMQSFQTGEKTGLNNLLT
jgi:hypothetical protein